MSCPDHIIIQRSFTSLTLSNRSACFLLVTQFCNDAYIKITRPTCPSKLSNRVIWRRHGDLLILLHLLFLCCCSSQQMAASARFLLGMFHTPNFSRGWLCSDRHNDAAISAFGLETVCIFSTSFKIRAQQMGNKFSWQFEQISAESHKLDTTHTWW